MAGTKLSLWTNLRVSDGLTRQISRNGIYFLNFKNPPLGTIDFFEFATRKKISIFSLNKPAPDRIGGLAVSPDGRSILYGQSESPDSYIMLVKNFR